MIAITSLIQFNNVGGDIFGGVTTAVVSLPLALAFGGAGLFHSLKCLKMQGFRISKTSLGFNFRHQDSQKVMNFALRFIANDIDKIHLITNETALLCCKGEVPHSYSL
ncbi:sulfate transporter [Fischerella sp. NIES-4106]|nr:sulfate transporter [Fischerella sp. NIES-4106]